MLSPDDQSDKTNSAKNEASIISGDAITLQRSIDEIKEAGGEDFQTSAYQCGKCDTVCPWNRVRNFSMRKVIRQADFGLTEIDE